MGSLPVASHDRIRVPPSCTSCDCGLTLILLGAICTHYTLYKLLHIVVVVVIALWQSNYSKVIKHKLKVQIEIRIASYVGILNANSCTAYKMLIHWFITTIVCLAF